MKETQTEELAITSVVKSEEDETVDWREEGAGFGGEDAEG